MTGKIDFKRIVLGLHRSAADRTSLGLAVELAELLRVDLLGIFLADEGIFRLAGLPFARELRSLGGGWRALDVDELGRDVELMARNAQRLFAEMAVTLRTDCSFSVMRGASSETIATVSRAGDIVMIVEPEVPAERVTHPFAAVLAAALRSAASVMLVPRRVVRRTGPVVAISATPEDASIAAALPIAAAAGEDRGAVAGFETDRARSAQLAEAAAAVGLRGRTVVRRGPPKNASVASLVLAGLNERLLVMSRRAVGDSMPSMLATLRRVPVLVVDGDEDHGADML